MRDVKFLLILIAVALLAAALGVFVLHLMRVINDDL